MPVVLDGKTLESSLIDVPVSRGAVVGVIAHRMRGRDPPQKLAHRAVQSRPEDEMPMVRHQLKREQLHVVAVESCFENALEGFLVGLLAKDARSPISAIEGMVESVGFVGARRSRHDGRIPVALWTIKQ